MATLKEKVNKLEKIWLVMYSTESTTEQFTAMFKDIHQSIDDIHKEVSASNLILDETIALIK